MPSTTRSDIWIEGTDHSFTCGHPSIFHMWVKYQLSYITGWAAFFTTNLNLELYTIYWIFTTKKMHMNKIRYLNWRNRPLIYRQKLKLKELILRVINLFIEITKYSTDSEVKNIEQIWKHISKIIYSHNLCSNSLHIDCEFI
jgi:hypothetical protein